MTNYIFPIIKKKKEEEQEKRDRRIPLRIRNEPPLIDPSIDDSIKDKDNKDIENDNVVDYSIKYSV